MSKRVDNKVDDAAERGRTTRQVGIALVVLGVLVGLVLRFVPLRGDAATLVFANVGLLLTIIVGAFLLYRGKQYAAQAQAQVWGHDDPSVVYLRSFSEDESMAGQVLTAPLNYKLMSGLASNEEQLAEAVAPIGTMIAIGRPGERLPKPGAFRTYASDDEWREVVEHWLSIARLVILRAGATEGLWWEIKRTISTVSPDRVLFLMLGLKRSAYESFAERVRDELAIELPDFNEVRRWGRVSGFFAFRDDWKPRFLPLRAPYWRASAYKPMVRRFHYALQPVFQRLGVGWRPAPISVGKVIAAPFMGLLALLFLFVLVTAITS